jgi:alpha-L-arabinofuranosidase
VAICLSDRKPVGVEDAQVISGPNAKAANSFARPNVIQTRHLPRVRLAAPGATVTLPPLSVAAVTLRLK